MNVGVPNLRNRIASGLLAASACAVAWSSPTMIAPGQTVPIPPFSGSAPTVKVLFDTGVQTDMLGGVTVRFDEMALQTSLDPSGVSFGFVIAASNTPSSLGATLPGFGGFMTAVETCVPFVAGPAVCGPAGTASRSTGTGEVLTFAGLGTTPVTVGPVTVNASNIYGIFTDASGFMHPTTVTVVDDGSTFSFNGIGASSSTGVPEPATLTLLGLGLLGIGLTRRRRA
jgi:PEP-CTERM motif